MWVMNGSEKRTDYFSIKEGAKNELDQQISMIKYNERTFDPERDIELPSFNDN